MLLNESFAVDTSAEVMSAAIVDENNVLAEYSINKNAFTESDGDKTYDRILWHGYQLH